MPLTVAAESDRHVTQDTPPDQGASGHGKQRWQPRLERAMTGLHGEIDAVEIRAEVVREARTTIPQLIDRITAQVQGGVTPYAGPSTGRRRRLIVMAVSAAVNHFLDSIEDPGTSGRRVDELFRRMGHGEATEGHELVALQAAFRIASHEAWEKIRSFAVQYGLTAEALGFLGDALFAYIEHLAEQAQLGFDGANRALDRSPDLARLRLAEGILTAAPAVEIRTHAGKASWPVPSQIVIVRIEPPSASPVPALADLGRQHLVHQELTSAIIITAADHLSQLLEELSALASTDHLSATSWPVPLEQAPDAARWTARALQLVARGVIPRSPTIDCAEHRAQLWLHAEPALRQRMCLDLLQPLLAETPNSREILSETLLAWLESRDSAPAIAAKLGVHAQTVRYRWKRINELFGDDLRDPEFVMQVTMLLKASVPLWKAGDQSDFERFRTKGSE